MRLRDRVQVAFGQRLFRLPTPILRFVARPEPRARLDPRVAAGLALVERLRPRKLHMLPPRSARREMEMLRHIWDAPSPEVGVVTRTDAGPVPARIYRPAGSGPHPVLVYFHGGGGVIGSSATHDLPCRVLCNEARCVVASFDYRLAPEHPFPAAVEDAVAAFRWARDAIDSDGRVLVGGDSMGGCLAAVVSQQTRADPEGGPAAQLLIYPLVDLTADTESRRRFAEGLFLTAGMIEWFHELYLGDAEPSDPRASPALAQDLGGLPPAVVLTAGFDPLRDEGNAYAEALAAAGVHVVHRCYEDQVHGYLHMTGLSERALEATVDTARALAHVLRR